MAALPHILHTLCGTCGDTIALFIEPIQVHPAGCATVTTTVLSVDTRLLDLHNAHHHPKEA